MQKIMTCTTARADIRARIDGWTFEDGDLAVDAPSHVGMIGSPRFPLYPTVLHALGDGWKLIGPPQPEADVFGWWLSKD
jgi:hypothetical protein